MESDLREQVQAKLLEARIEWERRLDAIQADRRREGAPLDPDFGDQAIQRENDAALDALDARGRQELEAIESTLQRIASGTFGRCVRCSEAISPDRLRAQPTAGSCLPCAREEDAAS
jgi:RNA polymerase-binding transcription factor DksA